MTTTEGRAVAVTMTAIALFAGPPSAAAERVLLMRSFPTDVRWGEISIAEGPSIEVLVREDRVAYPFSVTVACNERQRREDANDPTGQAVVTPVRRRGAIYFAAQLTEGRGAWNKAVDRLQVRLAALTPESFGTFAQGFGKALIGAEPVLEGAFEGVMCLTLEGQSDQAWEIHRVIKDAGVATGSSSFSDSRPVCAKLVGALEGAPPSNVLASRFEVQAQREESLTVDDTRVSGENHAAWPKGAGIEYAQPPEAATSYTNAGGGDGAVWYEELRPARDGGPQPTRKPYLLKASSKSATIAVAGLDSDALLTRWIWRVRDLTLGTEPKTSGREVAVLNAAFLFVEEHGRGDQAEFERSVAREFASSDQSPGISLLRGLLKKHARTLGADAMYVVFCDPTRSREATYCVASACEQVQNADDFCGALAARLDLISTP